MALVNRSSGFVNSLIVETAVIGNGFAVKFGSDNTKVVLAAAATDLIIGVAYVPGGDTNNNTAAVGDYVDVIMGFCSTYAKAGGTIAAGDRVTSDAAGKLITTTTALNKVVGIALAAAASNDLVPIMLTMGATV